MKTYHTPGPWTTKPEEDDKPYIRIRGARLGTRYKIANVIKPDWQGGEHDTRETRANARLIAAAPDMLEALKLVSTKSANGFTGCCYCGYVEEAGHRPTCPVGAAIAKATGEEAQ